MGGDRQPRGFSWRACVAVAVSAPIIGAVAVLTVVGSSGAASGLADSAPTAARSVPSSSASPRHRVGATPISGADAVATAPGTSTPGLNPTPVAASVAVAPQGPAVSVPDPTTESQVAQDLMAAIDSQSSGRYAIAATADNVTLIDSWMANEGGLWADNPLNTSLDADRYPHQITTSGQNTGIPIFPDIEVGVGATATTLLSNHSYDAILAQLSLGDASCPAFAGAVIDSPWAASHYGHDPARFCGASAGSGTGTVPVVTACLHLPNRGKRGGVRTTRAPGVCGRDADRGGRARSSRPRAGHRVATHRSARRGFVARHSAARLPGHHPAIRSTSVRSASNLRHASKALRTVGSVASPQSPAGVRRGRR